LQGFCVIGPRRIPAQTILQTARSSSKEATPVVITKSEIALFLIAIALWVFVLFGSSLIS
jgi:hypothetical protein